MKILLTGGSGRLGTELKKLLPNVIAPASSEFDITNEASTERGLEHHQPDLIVHAAAYTDVKGAESNKAACWKVNVEGTRNLVKNLGDTPLIHISTDYVFYGDTGNYYEDDPVGPVRNYYSLSKLVAEETARLAKRHLVLRTSFRPSEWPYPKAFSDYFTGQDYVDIIAPEVALAIQNFNNIPFNILHIVTERKSVYDLAKRRNPDVEAGLKTEAGVDLPDDISLNTERWQQLKKELLKKDKEHELHI